MGYTHIPASEAAALGVDVRDKRHRPWGRALLTLASLIRGLTLLLGLQQR